ncbi:RidA family protein [Microbacteriaceae bacterium VKM Ac-2855]|nr:RidA family protein [Microbacteriaceae bacterium VKM Ac-2855]
MPTTPTLSPSRTAGGLVFSSGCLPRDADSGLIVGGGIREQTRVTLQNVSRILAAEELSLADVVRVGVYLADIDRDFDEFNVVYGEYFSRPFPARTTVGARLRGALVEIDVVAFVPQA